MLFPQLSDAFRAAAVSRRSRLESVDPHHLVLVVRRQVLDPWSRWHLSDLVAVARSSALRGCEEAEWLLTHLEGAKVPVREDGRWGEESLAWLLGTIANEESPIALYYTAQMTSVPYAGRDAVTDMFEQAARDGFAPAMAALSEWTMDFATLPWATRAAALHDPDALNFLAQMQDPEDFALHLEAATYGSAGSMHWLSDVSDEMGLSQLQRSYWRARAFFLFGTDRANHVVSDALSRMTAVHVQWREEDVRLVFQVGREVEGFEQVRRNPPEASYDIHRCIDLYLWIVHTARRAALQAVVVMRQLGVPRDVAIMIGRIVYSSRDDVAAWCAGLGSTAAELNV